MHHAFADKHCSALPDAERVHPFGPETIVWVVNGHMFAAYTEAGDGISVRTADTNSALQPVEADGPSTLPTLTGEGWVVIPWETPIDDLRARIDESYNLVRTDWPNAIPRDTDDDTAP